uniref:Ribonuclease H-like domain-containing protein n=1 Tax=Tanacetum cinerariifolium TaxID=118510 RepID=A0A6L2LZV9_TANCI|nr:ribonuclease H-like domain-containing protein [Tanacetum cinerariifolium]
MTGDDNHNADKAKTSNHSQQIPPQTSQLSYTVSSIKLPILKKEEYDIWAMKMKYYLCHTDYLIWKVIQNGNGPVFVTTDTNGMIKVLPPKTTKEVVARERERKARTTLLMAIPEDHLAKFHKMADAKEMWEAIKSRFSGNDESKKMLKYFVKQYAPQLDCNDLEKINNGDLEEIDLKWQTVELNGIKTVEEELEGTIKTKLETKARDLHIRMIQKLWLPLMESNIGSDNVVQSCSKTCAESYARLKKLYDEQRDKLGDASVEITAYTLALKKDDAHKALKDKRIVDSGCSWHMTGSKAHLADYQEFKDGSVAFRGSNGRITGKEKIKAGRLEFEDEYYVEELKHYNLFFVSQMCDKKNKVLFTDTNCLVLSPDFKFPDESQVLLKIPRKHNMYSFNLKNIGHSVDLSSLFRKASIDESNKWHRRLSHVNFKNLNKLVKRNLVRGVPSKIFENDHTCVACQKGKQHKASCKAKTVIFVNQPLQILHMDLFGPTYVHKKLAKVQVYKLMMIKDKIQKTTDCKTSEKPVSQVEQIFQEELEKLKRQEKEANDAVWKEASHETHDVNTNSTNLLNAVSAPVSVVGPSRALNNDEPSYPDDPLIPHLKDIYASSAGIFTDSSYDDEGVVTNFNNLEITVTVSPTPTTKIHTIHPKTQSLRDPHLAIQIRSKVYKNSEVHALISQALEDKSWVDAMEEELLQFKIQKVWILVDMPFGKKAIGTKWIYKNKKDERGVVVRNKARLVTQRHRQEEWIDYDEVFALMARIEAIRILLAFASYICYKVYQMDVKSAFLYGTIGEEVYVTKQHGFVDPKFPNKVYKVVKALYGLHQAPRACVKTASTLIKTQKPLVKDEEAAEYVTKSRLLWLLLLQRQNMLLMLTVTKTSRSFVGFEVILLGKKIFMYRFSNHTSNGYQFTMSNPHQELASPGANGSCKELASPKQTALGKDESNPLIVDSLLKTIWSSMHYVIAIKHWLFQSKRYCLVKNIEAGVPFYMFPRFVQLIVDHQLGDMSHHQDIYDNPSLFKKVFANMRRVGTGFSGVNTPLFESMLVQAAEEVGEAQDDVSIPIEPSTSKPHKKHKSKKQQPTAPKIPSLEPSTEHYIPSPSNDLIPDVNKDRVHKLEEENRILKETSFKSAKVDVVAPVEDKEESFKHGRVIEDMDEDVDVDLEQALAKSCNLDLQHLEKVLSMQDTDEEGLAEVEEVLEVVTCTKLITEVVTTAQPTTTATQLPKPSASRKRREPKPLKRQAQIEQDEAFARQLEAELNANINWNDVIEKVKKSERQNNEVIRYEVLKRKPLTEAHARKNMMIYLKNMAEKEEEVTIQEKKIKEEGNKRQGKNLEQDIAKKQKMDKEEEELKDICQLWLMMTTMCTLKLLLSHQREDLETLWKLIKERFGTTEPKNFSDDFLLNILKIMFKKPNVEASMFLLVEKKYPLTHFTLLQMLDNVRLEVKEESKMSLELLRHGPYVRRMIPEPGDLDCEVPVAETFHEQTDEQLIKKEVKQMEADDQDIHTILMGLSKDIYVVVDSCETA